MNGNGYDATDPAITWGASSDTPMVGYWSGKLIAKYSSNSTAVTSPCATCYISTDHLGSTRLVTGDNAAVIARHDYLPFGEEILTGQAGRNSEWGVTDNINQKFTGKQRDLETNLDYFGARYLSGPQGRFVSPDEFKGGIVDPFTGLDIETNTALPYADITDPQTLNKYVYVRNNPLRYMDPDGHCAEALTCTLEFGTAGAEIGSFGGPLGTAAGAVIGGAIGAFAGYEIYKGAQAVVSLATNNNSTEQAQSAGGGQKAGSVKTADAPGVTAGGQATDAFGNKLGPSGKPQVNTTKSNTREGANNKALNEGSRSVEHSNPKTGKPHFHPADNKGNKKPASTHHEYPEN